MNNLYKFLLSSDAYMRRTVRHRNGRLSATTVNGLLVTSNVLLVTAIGLLTNSNFLMATSNDQLATSDGLLSRLYWPLVD